MKVTVTDYRNPQFIDTTSQRIDLEINTEQYGWIPTTIVMDDEDPAEHIVQIKQWLLVNQNLIAPYTSPIKTDNDVYTEKYHYITNERNKALKDPNAKVTTPDNLVWQVDPTSMEQLNDALTTFSVLGGTPEGFVWRDAANTNHPADLAFLAGIAAARATQVQSIWNRSWTLKADLEAAFAAGDRSAMEAIYW